jgi:cytochrome c2
MKRTAAVVGFIMFGMFAVSTYSSPAAAAAPAGLPSPAIGDPVKGMKVYADQKCPVCHRIGDAGGKLGPDLTAIGAKRDAAWLAKYLPNPATIDPKNPPKIKMPPTKATGADLDDLIAYLLSLKGKK